MIKKLNPLNQKILSTIDKTQIHIGKTMKL